MNAPVGAGVALTPLDIDVAIVGSGAAGLSAALTAAAKGLTVAVFEKDRQLGGTSAWCSGWMWIPGARPAGAGDPADAWTYLQAELGPTVFAAQRAKVKVFLDGGPAMLDFFSETFRGTMAFEKDTDTPDFHASPGQHFGGRMVRVPAFDGRRLGGDIERLRRPLPEFTVLGMAIEAGADLNAFLAASRFYRSRRAVRAAGRVVRLSLGHLYDLITCRRGMRLVNGNALVARLMACAAELGGQRVRLYTSHAVTSLGPGATGGYALTVNTPDGERHVRAARAVVLACGGFAHDLRRIGELFPPVLARCGHHSAAPEQNTGDGLRLGELAAGQVVPTAGAAAAFVPVSLRRRRDGSRAVYPHFIERAKPGVIAVQRDGRRFCDEAIGYHDFVRCWLVNAPRGEPVQAWLGCDYASLRRFGLGMVRPFSLLPLGSLSSGYLKAAWTLEGLARRCGIAADALCDQVARYNAGAPAHDPQYGRGDSAYDRSQGDALTRPNPCVGRIAVQPFFAVKLLPGSLGTLAGLQTDEHARVLDAAGRAIPGLYAAGNDMAAVMGGAYPTNGVTLASAMTFGHIAGCHIAGCHIAARHRAANAPEPTGAAAAPAGTATAAAPARQQAEASR
jgi:succinate dehydrogenase/fumarate reductase flavoprotein subunit